MRYRMLRAEIKMCARFGVGAEQASTSNEAVLGCVRPPGTHESWRGGEVRREGGGSDSREESECGGSGYCDEASSKCS